MTTSEAVASLKVGATFSNRLRHVESMSLHPSGAGRISHLSVIILGSSFAGHSIVFFYWKEKWNPEVYTENIDVRKGIVKFEIEQPILFLSGLQDELVPPLHMQMPHSKAIKNNLDCRFVDFPNVMHMDIWYSGGDRGFCHELAQMCQISRMVEELDLLIVILPDNDGSLYGDQKQICETSLALVSQCCLTKHVFRMRKQYLANVGL
ncbi:hypothetical protein ZIOFF_048434 [Zingiber officinale]|uniref:Piwi domain-containing protein n=1 Tax=Zingiber officinale TaxID=94328 RepID=A0A8J5FR72_ZINOF|nr:hypothetical protein ZIOFF_048434 [Zingiber officinale]